MVLAGNEQRAFDELLKGEIGHFRSELGLDNKKDMVSSKWIPLFLYCTTGEIFKSRFQKKLATITIQELVTLPQADPHTILNLETNDDDHHHHYSCTPIQLAVTARDAEYGVNVLQALLSIAGCRDRAVMPTNDGYTPLQLATLRKNSKMVELLEPLTMAQPKCIQINNEKECDDRLGSTKRIPSSSMPPHTRVRATAAKSKPDTSKRNKNNHTLDHNDDDDVISYHTIRSSSSSSQENMINQRRNKRRRKALTIPDGGVGGEVAVSSSSSLLLYCCVCQREEHNNNNIMTGFLNNNRSLLKCEKCGRYAHSTCYRGFVTTKGGGSTTTTSGGGRVSCLSCRTGSSLAFKCGICGLDDKTGSFMVYRSDLPGQFVHIRCALFLKPDRLHEDALECSDKLHIIGNLVKIGRRRQCVICSKPGAVRCGYPGCNVRYHPSCIDNAIHTGNNNDTYKRIIRGPGMKKPVSVTIKDENFQRMTKCGHTYLRVFCEKHKNGLCICGKMIKDGEDTLDCRLKDEGCIYGTLHKACMKMMITTIKDNNNDSSSSTLVDGGRGRGLCPHCDFCISSSGKLPNGPCCSTCVFCVYAYRDRTISSDEESGGEELGQSDAHMHIAVLPKYRPPPETTRKNKNNRNQQQQQEEEGEEQIGPSRRRRQRQQQQSSSIMTMMNDDDDDDHDTSSSSIYGILPPRRSRRRRRTVVTPSSSSSLECVVRACIGDDELASWMMIDILDRNSIRTIDELKTYLSSRSALIIPKSLRNELRYHCSLLEEHPTDDDNTDMKRERS